MKKISLLFILVSFTAFAQNITNYKYVVVPKKFAIFNEQDKYNLNTYSKLLLEKYGFIAIMDDYIPSEIANNRCKALFMDLIDDNGLLMTKLKIVLKDCQGVIVYETALGKSRDKSYDIAFRAAFREAAKSFETLDYTYTGETAVVLSISQATSTKIEEPKTQNAQTATTELSEKFYFAQPIVNGFQVVNSEPKVIMRLLNTSQKDVFIAYEDEKQGVVISKNGNWFFEYYEGAKLISESINLKF